MIMSAFRLNPHAKEFIWSMPVFNEGTPSCVLKEADAERFDYLHSFDRNFVADEDLFNPAVYPVSPQDHEELAAVDAFNLEMALLEDLEHQEELYSLLQDRINALHHGVTQRPAKITSLSINASSGHPCKSGSTRTTSKVRGSSRSISVARTAIRPTEIPGTLLTFVTLVP
ncbi:unnamed protein product [Discosporangium mesarthrocarpum]